MFQVSSLFIIKYMQASSLSYTCKIYIKWIQTVKFGKEGPNIAKYNELKGISNIRNAQTICFNQQNICFTCYKPFEYIKTVENKKDYKMSKFK